MQDWPDDLLAELVLQPTTLCRLYVVAPVVGTTLRFTDHNEDLVVGGDTYLADNSFQPSALQVSVGGATTNFDLTVLFNDDAIGFNDVMAKHWQGATVSVYLASYGNPSAGKGIINAGKIGAFTTLSKLYGTMSIVGGTGIMNKNMTEVYSPTCRADFGDARCTIDLTTKTHAFTLDTVTDRMDFISDSGSREVDGFYNLGTVVWSSGLNAGTAQELAYSLADGTVALFYPPGYAMTVGDTGNLIQGCAKTLPACTAYDNVPNMRAEPYVPGDDPTAGV